MFNKAQLTKRALIVTLIVLLVAILGGVETPSAQAAGFAVNSTTDAVDANPGDGLCETAVIGQCTLRAAVQEANALSGLDVINVPAGTYTLTISGAGEDAAATGDLDLTDSVTISGAGAGVSIIDASGLDRALHGMSGVTVELSSLSVRNGLLSSGGGAGLLVGGTATVTDTEFSNNTANSSADGRGGAAAGQGGPGPAHRRTQ